MFRFFNRVRTLVSAELNSALDKAEDPVKMLDQYMIDMGKDIAEVEAAVANQIANEKMLEKKLNDAQTLVEKREQQAIHALEAGEEDLARRLLEDKQNHQQQVDTLQASYEEAQSLSEELRGKLQEMKDEYQQMKLKKDALQARAVSAKTRTKVNRTLSDVNHGSARDGFNKMEEKVLQYEAEAETSEDMRSANRSLDDEVKSLTSSNKVDDELAALKARLNKE
ncbi:PspA/IM30 family protein [Desmospora activa]|uniref:Phage shock protein A (PspA) family protein n=1 Tax=Desmospora activa DSM 45169 TaxID=1121389 RepID=A0A2T4ZA91_9BACL|nr:PspA/IM30 family protein [Desmospora activa]PTM58812.1 phage shock protein A (PspA) family protein [Desmospora activa DSM 45169]